MTVRPNSLEMVDGERPNRVSDTEIGGVRKVTSDTADTVPITPSRLLTRFLASG